MSAGGAAGPIKAVLIDEDEYFCSVARKFLERDLPEAVLTHGDAAAALGGSFDWSRVDVLLLAHDLGERSGLDVLGEVACDPHSGRPRVIYLPEHCTEDLSLAARRLGAVGVIGKRSLSGARLADAVRAAHRAEEIAADEPDASEACVRARRPAPLIEGYKIANQIGAGARSRVFLAEREVDRLTVVLKLIELDLVRQHAHVKRFVEEAELLGEIDSRHVVRLFGHGFTDAYGFIAMEFFPRGDLKQRIEHGIPPGDAVHCLANLAYGLEAIHGRGIVHRDVKPANVMFRADDTLALADFGIAMRLTADGVPVRPGTVLGTPHYMSPEQGQGKPVDPRNDIYSLGVLFYEMLTREKPFTAESPAELVREHLNAPIPRLPGWLRRYQGLVDRMLAKRPEERFQSASELIAAL